MGSVAEEVVRKASAPSMVINAPQRKFRIAVAHNCILTFYIKEVSMVNLYLEIKWSSALVLGFFLILTGVVGMFMPLVPEIAVILLGMWLLAGAAVNPLGRRRLIIPKKTLMPQHGQQKSQA